MQNMMSICKYEAEDKKPTAQAGMANRQEACAVGMCSSSRSMSLTELAVFCCMVKGRAVRCENRAVSISDQILTHANPWF